MELHLEGQWIDSMFIKRVRLSNGIVLVLQVNI
jgi:hypothetical protein